MYRFYWVIEGVLAGCSRPGAASGDLDGDLAALVERGVGALLTLTERPLAPDALARHGLRGLHLPVEDFTAPTTQLLLDAFTFLDDAIGGGVPAAVHCMAGQGRTGTVLAAYLMRGGLGAGEAIVSVRAVCPGAIESPAQAAALEAWSADPPWLA